MTLRDLICKLVDIENLLALDGQDPEEINVELNLGLSNGFDYIDYIWLDEKTIELY